MSAQTDDVTTNEGRKRPGWIWAMAAFVAVIAIGAILLLLNNGGSGEPVVPPPNTTMPTETTLPESETSSTLEATPTTSAEEGFAARMAIVDAMIEARNSGDYEAWRAFFPAEKPNIFGGLVNDESELEWQRSYMAANEVWTKTGPCSATITGGVGCPMTLVNDFFGPAGIFYAVPNLEFYFTQEGELGGLGAGVWDIAGDPAGYADDFDAWLAEAYPEVHAGFGPRVDGEGALPNPDDMPTALQYVEEFIAQSDKYPLGG